MPISNAVNAALSSALTQKDSKTACALADRIAAESRMRDVWYADFDTFASLLSHQNSLVRNRVLRILAENCRWDTENRFDAILAAYLSHITDKKPITARQCVQALAEVGYAKPRLVPPILSALKQADFSAYPDSMRPLLEKDRAATLTALQRNMQAAPTRAKKEMP